MTHKNQRWLAAVALASLGLYLCLAVRYPLLPSLAQPRASWMSLIEPTLLHAAQHIVIYLCLFLLYMAALRLLEPAQDQVQAQPAGRNLLIVVVWLTCSGALMFAAPAGESHDIFDYLFRGRMMVEYHANPLVDAPNTFELSTPYARYLAWHKHVDTYGPLWEATSAALAGAARRAASWRGWWDESYPVCPKSVESCRLLAVYITVYRLLAIALTGLSGWFVAGIVRLRRPACVPMALAAWLWNPLTLIVTALGGHNDAVMLVLVFGGWWLLQRQRPLLGIVALILAAHVKLTAVIWLPAGALWIVWRYGQRQALKIGLASAASGAALSWLLYAPFGGWQTLPRMLQERSAFLANSPWQVAKHWMEEAGGWFLLRAHLLCTSLPNWLSAAGALLIPLRMFDFLSWRRQKHPVSPQAADETLWRALAGTSLLFLLVGSFWFQHWYVLWVLAPAVLLPDRHLTRYLLPFLAFGALSSNVAMDYLWVVALETALPIWEYLLPVVFIWGPLLTATGITALSRSR